MYIGHRREDGTCQPLQAHLLGVAERAGNFAAAFGAADHAYRTGLLHDIGKYAPDVQRRMADPAHVAKVNHTSAGAITAQEIRDLHAAFAVAGHHGGLRDLGSRTDTAQDKTLQGKLKYKPQDYSAYQLEIRLDRKAMAPSWMGRERFAGSFYTRMLFSCLVDADFLDTEAFMRGGTARNEARADMHALLAKLNAYIAPWFPAQGEINARRCEILNRCREMGTGEKGVYTLTVPTGGGKTVSSLAFALRHAAAHGSPRILYVVPYMSIIEQNAARFAEILGEENVLEHHSGVEYEENELDDAAARAMLRKRLATENWDAPIVVTTAVQFFESLFAASTSKCRKLHNIAGSVIVLDEAQMLPLGYLKPCVYALAELVRHYGATVVLCTATQPALDGLLHAYAPELPITEIMTQPQEMYAFFRRVTFRQEGVTEESRLADAIAREEQVLCVVNTKKRAQSLYELLPEEGRYHLSTLMTPRDRKAALQTIRDRLKRGETCRVISTSLIEAGVDVDFPAVWREEAGLDSILQAAGRCNREGKRSAQDSVVHVFAMPGQIPRAYVKPVQAMRAALDEAGEIDSLHAIEQYSRHLIKAKGEYIDGKQIVPDCEAFRFRTVAEHFKLIEEDTVPVYIPTEENGQELEALKTGNYDRKTIRRLQMDAVSLYHGQAEAMMGAGKILQTADGFLVLTDPDSYSRDRGLTLCLEQGQGIFVEY